MTLLDMTTSHLVAGLPGTQQVFQGWLLGQGVRAAEQVEGQPSLENTSLCFEAASSAVGPSAWGLAQTLYWPLSPQGACSVQHTHVTSPLPFVPLSTHSRPFHTSISHLGRRKSKCKLGKSVQTMMNSFPSLLLPWQPAGNTVSRA